MKTTNILPFNTYPNQRNSWGFGESSDIDSKKNIVYGPCIFCYIETEQDFRVLFMEYKLFYERLKEHTCKDHIYNPIRFFYKELEERR
jgi:hypothetical protein